MRAKPILILATLLFVVAPAPFALDSPKATTAVQPVLYIVDTATDDKTANNGMCSLREAITNANGVAFGDQYCGPLGGANSGIVFSLSGSHIINVTSPLPNITQQMSIDGGAPKVEINGAGVVGNGIKVASTAPGTSIKNLVIHDFNGDEVRVEANSVFLRGNYIGTNAAGTAAGSVSGDGVSVTGSTPTIGGPTGTTSGGPCIGDCNLISGNGVGIFLDSTATGATIQGNFIGTNAAGTAEIHNHAQGIRSFAATTYVGGSGTGQGNLISGNQLGGVGFAGGNGTVQGNRIGTNAVGTTAIPNLDGGVYLFAASGSTVGGTFAGAGNLISGNSGYGINVWDSSTVQIKRNLIGTQADGVSPLPNTFDGIDFVSQFSGAQSNVVGGTPDDGNVIAFNGRDGVRVDGLGGNVVSNLIWGNSIHDNTGKGIENINGGNSEVAPPVITAVGSASGTACAFCHVEVFSDTADEGKRFEGTVKAESDGHWSFDGSVTGPYVTATNTNLAGSTSEFSAPFAVPATPTPTPSPTPTLSPTPTPTPTASATIVPSTTHSSTPIQTPVCLPGGAFCPQLHYWGDNDCTEDIDGVDALLTLAGQANLPLPTPAGCPAIGPSYLIDGVQRKWGDVLCFDFNAPEGVLAILAYIGHVPQPTPIDVTCPAVGQIVTVG